MKFTALFSTLLMASTALAEGFWNLPVEVRDDNTTVTFEVDSTWHLIEGKTKNLNGKVWLLDPKDFRSVRAEIILPVADFDTDGKSRDKEMRSVMHADKHPTVKFELTTTEDLCDPKVLTDGKPCKAIAHGTLSINNVAKVVTFPIELVKSGQTYAIKGVTSIQWEDYGIEDPSILIAKLDPTVNISFTITLPDNSNMSQHAKHS